MVGVVKDIGRGLINGHSPCAGGRVGLLLTRVELQGFKFQRHKFQILPFFNVLYLLPTSTHSSVSKVMAQKLFPFELHAHLSLSKSYLICRIY